MPTFLVENPTFQPSFPTLSSSSTVDLPFVAAARDARVGPCPWPPEQGNQAGNLEGR